MTRFGRTLFTLSATAALAITMLAQPPQGGPAGKGGAPKGKGPGGPGGFGGPGGAPGGRGGAGGGNAKQAAPIDLTGNWVSLVTEDWLYRMVTPAKGDFASVPASNAAKQVAMQWDPAKDESAGEQCKGYGAAALMRLPTHLQIDWADDNTLRIQTTAGTQTRLMHFQGDPAGPASLQGFSKASWEGAGGRGGRGGGGGFGGGPPAAVAPVAGGGRAAQPIRAGSLKVLTTNLSGGYIRKNGLPYGPQTTLNEYYDVLHEPNGDEYLLITTQVEDPANLTGIYRTSTHFKKEADASKFKATPCSAR